MFAFPDHKRQRYNSDFLLPRTIADRAFAAGIAPQNEIVWVKAIEIDGIIRGHCKPGNSSSRLTRMNETVLHLAKRGDVPLDKLALCRQVKHRTSLSIGIEDWL